MSYKVLYLLQSSHLIILEVNYLGLPDTAPLDARYRWLRYAPLTKQLCLLNFVSMQSAPPFEEREFVQGSLVFSGLAGIFRPANTKENIILQRDFLLDLPATLVEQLAQSA